MGVTNGLEPIGSALRLLTPPGDLRNRGRCREDRPSHRMDIAACASRRNDDRFDRCRRALCGRYVDTEFAQPGRNRRIVVGIDRTEMLFDLGGKSFEFVGVGRREATAMGDVSLGPWCHLDPGVA